MRLNNRKNDELRQIKFTRNYTKNSLGSVLVEFGDTKVIVKYEDFTLEIDVTVENQTVEISGDVCHVST